MKKYSHKNIRKLARISRHSYGVVIPKEFIRKLGWKERQKLVLDLRGKKVSIRDYEK